MNLATLYLTMFTDIYLYLGEHIWSKFSNFDLKIQCCNFCETEYFLTLLHPRAEEYSLAYINVKAWLLEGGVCGLRRKEIDGTGTDKWNPLSEVTQKSVNAGYVVLIYMLLVN